MNTTTLTTVIPTGPTFKNLDTLDLLGWYKNLNIQAEEHIQAGSGVVEEIWDALEAIQDEILERTSR